MTFDAAAEVDMSPWDALTVAVRRRAARVQWVDHIIENIMKVHVAEGGSADVPPEAVRPWLAESRNEERLMTRAAKMAVDAGVADAVVRRLEMEGRIVTDAMIAGLDAIDLTVDQRLKVLSTMHSQLSGLPAAAAHPVIEGTVTDRNDDKDQE